MYNAIVIIGAIFLALAFVSLYVYLIYQNVKLNKKNKDEKYQKINASIWKKIFKVVFKDKKHFIGMALSIGVVAILDVLTPFINSKVVEVFFSDNPNFDLKWVYIGIYLLFAALYMVFIYFFIYNAGRIEAFVAYELRKEAFEKLQELPFSYYDKTKAGWIMSRLTSDSRKLSEILSWGFVDLAWGLLTMFSVLVMIYITNFKLALIITVLTPIMFSIALLFRKLILDAYRSVRKTNSKITSAFDQNIEGAKTTKTLVIEEKMAYEFDDLAYDMKKQSIHAVYRSSFLWPIILVIGYIGVAFTLGIGSSFILSPKAGLVISIPVLYLFINYTTLFFDPIMMISHLIANIQQAEAAAERIIELIETPLEIEDSKEVKEIYGTFRNPKRENFVDLIGDVEFKNVTFGYNEKEPILKNFNLHIKAGQSVALVGKTGNGKSTIINLLCRFYEPNEGEILIDGVDYRQRSQTWLHTNLGYVLQDPHLFDGTVKENIAYGKKDATMEEIIEAAKKAQADEFIQKLENGYDTQIGEDGSKLSQGEKQLLCFARTILINPKILILDEATSSIDTSTEVKIQEVTNNFMKGRTTFIVAHRLSTIVSCDLILVIMDGEIKESGSHEELLKKEGIYYNLYKTQFED